MNSFRFASPPVDDMHQMLSKSDLIALGSGDYSDASEYNNKNPRLYKVNHFILPLFLLEVTAVGCVGALAYYLRFTDLFPLQERIINCTDPGINYPYRNATSLLATIPLEVLYSVALLGPLVVILIGELGYWLFSSKPKKVVRAHCIGFKLHLLPRRFAKHAGLFLLGLFSTSIFTDLTKAIVARPRPYYRNVCDATCSNPDGSITVTDTDWCVDEELRQTHTSFPSFHAAIAVYSSLFIAVYMHSLLTARAARLFRPILIFALLAVGVFVGLTRFLAHRSHWQDVAVGYLLGGALAAYLGLFGANCFQESRTDETSLLSRRKSGASSPTMQLQDSKSPFFSWFPIPRVSFKTKPPRFINGFTSHGADYSHDAIPVVYHPEVNRSIDNFNNRNGHPHAMQHY